MAGLVDYRHAPATRHNRHLLCSRSVVLCVWVALRMTSIPFIAKPEKKYGEDLNSNAYTTEPALANQPRPVGLILYHPVPFQLYQLSGLSNCLWFLT